jgi:P27 family predicted phage terminase small subunit
MAKPGPPRKPTSIKKLEGNPGKYPLNDQEPEYAPVMVDAEPPAILTTEAGRALWRGLLPALASINVLQETDLQTMTRYCRTWGRYVEVEGLIDDMDSGGHPIHKYLQTTSNMNIIQNPLIGVSNRCSDMLLKLEAEMGLTPAARSRIVVPPKKQEKGGIVYLMDNPPEDKPGKQKRKRRRKTG